MTNPNAEPRFDGRSDRITVAGSTLPYESGALPEDFSDHLHRLKEASGPPTAPPALTQSVRQDPDPFVAAGRESTSVRRGPKAEE